jgi:probable F420-dependent oxidoreductase
MAHPRTFRFGIQLSTASSADDWSEKARRAEDLGYSTFLMPDHFGDQFAPVPALMAAADATTTLRVGALVFDNDYKHPLVLAKECATIDVLSGGRLEIGLGAGWMRSDYDQSGIAYDPPAIRIERFAEGLQVLKGLLAGESFSFTGQHYTITDHTGMPRPAQKPRPPILLGGGGPRVLRLAGQEADIVGINANLRAGEVGPDAGKDVVPEMIDRKVQWVKEGAGERFDDIELNVLVGFVFPTDDRDKLAADLAPAFGLSGPEALDVPLALIGTIDQMADDLERRRERWGFSYFVFAGDQLDAMAPIVDRLAGK